jgi:hypothetical protein
MTCFSERLMISLISARGGGVASCIYVFDSCGVVEPFHFCGDEQGVELVSYGRLDDKLSPALLDSAR